MTKSEIVAILRRNEYSTFTLEEIEDFVDRSAKYGLDPLKKQIYLIKRAGKPQIMASIDGLRAIALKHPDYAGQTQPFWCGDDGTWKDVWVSKTPPYACKIGVYRKGMEHPTYAIAYWHSYNQNNSMWQKYPEHMLAKSAESLCLRKSFCDEISGLYTDDEIGVDKTYKGSVDDKKLLMEKLKDYIPQTLENAEVYRSISNHLKDNQVHLDAIDEMLPELLKKYN